MHKEESAHTKKTQTKVKTLKTGTLREMKALTRAERGIVVQLTKSNADSHAGVEKRTGRRAPSTNIRK